MAVEASVIIEFEGVSQDPTGLIIVELDPEHANNLDSEGNLKSVFALDDEPVFLIHHEPTLEITRIKCTDGRLYSVSGSLDQTREFEALFTTKDTEINLAYSGVDIIDEETWYGNEGQLSLGYNKDRSWVLTASGDEFPCHCTGKFTVLFQERHRLVPPPLELDDDETYVIYVVIYVKEVAST